MGGPNALMLTGSVLARFASDREVSMIRSTARRVLKRLRRWNRRVIDALDPEYPPPLTSSAATMPVPEPEPEPRPEPEPEPRPEVSVRAEATPNPHAMKFDVGVEVGSRTLNNKADAADDPLGALFDLEGVVAVFAVTDFVTVLKAPSADWEVLVPAVEVVLKEALA
jgi:hypothetical protein